MRILKFTGLLIGLLLLAVAALAIHVVWFRPFDVRIFYEKAFIEFALESPELLSSIRMLEQIGIESHNDDLDDVSPGATRRRVALVAEDLEALQRYDRDDLEGQVALSYDALDWFLTTEVAGAEFAFHGYPVNQLFGVQNSFPQFMTSSHFLGDRGDAQDYVARLSKLDDKFAGLLADLRLREERGVVPPRFVIDRVLDEMRAFVAVPAGENILHASFAERLADLDSLSAADRDELLQAAEIEIRDTVYPAYAQLIAYFERLQPKVSTHHGASQLPDGARWYAWLLRQQTTTDVSPEAVHQLGLTEVARIETEMDAILRAEGYEDGPVGERMQRLNEEPRFLFPDTDAGREQILAGYRSIVADIESGMPALFGRLPRAALEVVAVPDYREESAALAYYEGPSFDGSVPGRFYVNLRDVGEHPRYLMRTLAYHEAVPGHHFQSAIQTELEGVAQFRRILPFTAYQEGWALYAERLAWESGYVTDPFDNLGRLQHEMLRAARLVVDTGIHRYGWSREQAIDYMLEKTGLKDSAVEVERYFVIPGQATAYKIGMQKILELRERARAELGEDFDIREFHVVVLENGALPMSILEQQVDAYIESKRNAIEL
jgi:uncharacterized protein (DUF885 family)